jgi:D-aminopeptidase
MMQSFEGADLVFFVGYHARAGTEGVLSHTFQSPTVVTGVWLNGEPCSERSGVTVDHVFAYLFAKKRGIVPA